MKQQSISSRICGATLSLVFMAIGVWAIYMAVKGETPAQPLDKPGDRVIISIFGAMFCLIGIAGTAHALLMGWRHAPTIVAAILAVAFVFFGLCFLSVAILQPGEISSTTSVGGVEVSRSKGGWGGAVAFSIVGVLSLCLAPAVYRGYKKTLQKNSM